MIYRALDSNEDYSFGKNQQNFLNGAAAVGQAIKTCLQLLLGEWWEDQEDGLPMFQSIAGAQAANEKIKENIDALIRERILGTPDVSSLESYVSTFDRTNRQFSVRAAVNTVYGQTAVEVSF